MWAGQHCHRSACSNQTTTETHWYTPERLCYFRVQVRACSSPTPHHRNGGSGQRRKRRQHHKAQQKKESGGSKNEYVSRGNVSHAQGRSIPRSCSVIGIFALYQGQGSPGSTRTTRCSRKIYCACTRSQGVIFCKRTLHAEELACVHSHIWLVCQRDAKGSDVHR